MRRLTATVNMAQSVRRKKVVGLTMLSLLFLDSVSQSLAHGATGGGFTGPMTPQVNALLGNTAAASPATHGWARHAASVGSFGAHTSPFGDIGKSQSGIPLIHQMPGHGTSVQAVQSIQSGVRHAHGNPTGITAVLPHGSLFTTELGQRGRTLDLDLTSASSEIILGSKLFAGAPSVTIEVGDKHETFRAGSVVTPGEFVAIQQVLTGGTQQVSLSNKGTVTGGSFALNTVDSRNVASLVIPQSVTAIDYFTSNAPVTLHGDLTNYGSIYGVTTNSKVLSGAIFASGIKNESGGLISTVLPDSILAQTPGAIDSNVSLTLQASHNIVNAGSMTSSGALTLAAGGSIENAPTTVSHGHAPVAPAPLMQAAGDLNLSAGSGEVVNAGLIASKGGNINIGSPNALANIDINARGGTFKATTGDINVRDSAYDGAADINMVGGNYLSQNVNLNSGAGTANASLGDVTGTVNVKACNAHVGADTADLKFGNLNVSGDPTYYNTGGSINLASISATNGQDLAIIASQDVTISGGSLDTTGASNAGNLTIVAGANITAPGSGSGSNDTTTTVTWQNSGLASKGSVTGGAVNLSGVGGLQATGTGVAGNGGNVQIVAYAGSNAGSGVIQVPTTISTGGAGTGTNGSVTMIAGNNGGGTTISSGTINTSGGSGGAKGTVLLSTAVPVISGSGAISVLDGKVQVGSGSYTSGSSQAGTVTLATVTAGDVLVQAGTDVNI
ncbi:MAG: hypothetical protein JSS86_00345, partial [Cyanobacteria bacterium SZAS LIN-2]|nr:hypothetical protein [Cyanobacteria bacterium SZAS LIN-2]